jgi:aldehyde dehydrogenase (NAD+)
MTFHATQEAKALLARLDVPATDGDLVSHSPIDGQPIGAVRSASPEEVAAAIDRAHAAFLAWRVVPPPRRGELVRLLGEVLRQNKEPLGALVSLEAGKILQEGLGEVQEMIDICDFAVGLSRQLYGLTIATERPGHRMMETWHPLGVVGVISAFNFPVAVWAWNACLAFVCGDAVLWKPSEKTPITAHAVQTLFERAGCALWRRRTVEPLDGASGRAGCRRGTVGQPAGPAGLGNRIDAMGRELAPRVAARFGRALLELGGNNGMIVAPSADLELASQAITFAAVGTAGQRCTTLRRLFVHRSIYDQLVPRLLATFAAVPVGNPLDPGTLVGPLIDQSAYQGMQDALEQARAEGGTGQRRRAPLERKPAGRFLCPARDRRDARPDPDHDARDLCTHIVRHRL